RECASSRSVFCFIGTKFPYKAKKEPVRYASPVRNADIALLLFILLPQFCMRSIFFQKIL
ncbi:MAG: hypothetical protein LUG56_01950, partial [Lachnospiraceae bacterium]|nr:hypothetical protein [Lachnospiraceae bacterium]